LAADRGIDVVVNCPFENGRLFQQVGGRELPGWAAEFGAQSWAQLFLKYILAHPEVTCVIPATSDPEHMTDDMRAGFGPLPDAAQRRRMEKLWAEMA
ncbi:MAG: aldo/keto reductase, partial [Thiohalorhabdaceae bacterium]